MAVMTPSAFFQGRTDHKAVTHRLTQAALMRIEPTSTTLAGRGGVRFSTLSMKVRAQAAPNMSVRMSPGLGVIEGSEAFSQGNYVMANDAEITPIAIAASHVTLQRVDIIYSAVRDAFYSGANNDVRSGLVVQGVNASVGTATANYAGLPANAFIHALVFVDPGVSSIVQNKIIDQRAIVGSQGGIRVIRDFEVGSAGVDYGDVRYWNGRLEGWNADATTGWRPVGVDNAQYITGGFSYLSNQSASYTALTTAIADPGYPYFIEGMVSGHFFHNNTLTRWDIVARLDTTSGTILSMGGQVTGDINESVRGHTHWFRSAVLTGAHSVLARYEKTFGGNSTFSGEGAAYYRVVPQPPAANAGVLVNV